MQTLGKDLPLYTWLVALPQLISRICHPNPDTSVLTQQILTRLLVKFPHQVIPGPEWGTMLIFLYVKQRSTACHILVRHLLWAFLAGTLGTGGCVKKHCSGKAGSCKPRYQLCKSTRFRD